METCTKTVRGFDKALYRQARADAALEGLTLGEWMNRAIRQALKK